MSILSLCFTDVPPGKTDEENDLNLETVLSIPATYANDRGNEIFLGNEPESRMFWILLPAVVNAVSSVYKMIRNRRQSLDNVDEETPRDFVLDSIGGGHLLKRAPALDQIGGGHLLKRTPILDQIGGGHLLKRNYEQFRRFLASGSDQKRSPVVDPIGGGHLLKRFPDLKNWVSLQAAKELSGRKPQDIL